MEAKLKKCMLDAKLVSIAPTPRSILVHKKYVPQEMFETGLRLSNPHIITGNKKLYLVNGDIDETKTFNYYISSSRRSRNGHMVVETLPAGILKED